MLATLLGEELGSKWQYAAVPGSWAVVELDLPKERDAINRRTSHLGSVRFYEEKQRIRDAL